MTRRAGRPSVSAGAGRAPVISKATELPCCAFGSITVLILLCLSRARGGREATLEKLSKKLRRELRAVKLVFRVLRLGGSEGEKHAGAAGTPGGACRARHRLVPSGAKIHPTRPLVKSSIATYIGPVVLTAPIERAP